MAGYFDVMGFDPNNAGAYNAEDNQRRLLMQALFQRQLSQPLDQGRMVSGWYVPPSRGATAANALSQALGGWMAARGMKQAETADKADREAYKDAIKALRGSNNPENYVARAEQANPMLTHTYADPNAVGPSLDELRGVTASPVSDGNMNARSLPLVGQPGVGLESAAAEARLASAPPLGTPVGAVAQQPAPTSPFNVDRDAESRINTERVKFLRREMSNDRDAAIDRLVRTNKGNKLGTALQAAMLERELSPDTFALQRVKQGDNEVLLRVNNRTGAAAPIFGGDGGGQPSLAERRFAFDQQQAANAAGLKADERGRGITEAIAANDNTLRMIDNFLPRAGDATGPGGKFWNWFSEKTGVPTDEAGANADLNAIKGAMMAAAMRMTKEQAGSAAGLSQVESEALSRSIGALETKMGKDALVRNLGEIQRNLRMYGDRLRSSQGGGAAPAPSSSPAGSFRVPGRGQRVTSPEDYGF